MQGRACASVSAEYEAPARDARTAETMWRCRCASLTSESVGAFSGLRVVWGELSVAPGRTARGGGGWSERWAAPRFFMWFLCPVARPQSYRGPTDPWRGGSVRFRALGPAPACGLALLSWQIGVLSWQSANQTTDLRVALYPIASL